jgi:uncharacterized protein (DUF2147 family)
MTRTLKWFAAAFFAALSVGPSLAIADPTSPVGQWQISTGEARYKVTTCGSHQLCAKLVWLRSDARTASNVALLNTYVVHGAQATAENMWSGDLNFDGHTYQGTMTLISSNAMSLKGCSGMLCQTYRLTRV